MISREQALAIADQWLNAGAAPHQRRRVGVHEFDLGYVVWAVPPPVQGPPGQRRPPEDTVGATGVVDRRSGELSTWPPVPVEDVVRMYRDKLGGGAPPPRVRPVRQAAPVGRPAVGPGNSVTISYRDARGQEVHLTCVSRPGLPHPLWQAWHELQKLSVPQQNVLTIHSELSSCYLPGGYCEVLLKSFPRAEVTYAQPYGDSRESRAAAVAARAEHAAEAGERAAPRANPAPVPPNVPPAPPMDGSRLGQELTEVFGIGKIRRYHPDELAHTNLPVPARATLTAAGVPATVPYFFRAAGVLSPVHEHLRAQTPTLDERVLRKLSTTNSVAIGDDGNAVICVQCGGLEIDQGRLWAVDPQAGWARFVNTSIAAFDRSLALMARAWPALRGLDPYAAGSLVADFQIRLTAIDPAALRDEANWWSLIVEQMWDGLL